MSGAAPSRAASRNIIRAAFVGGLAALKIVAFIQERGDDAPWWLAIDRVVREGFALIYGRTYWGGAPNGNSRSIVVGYPNAEGRVPMYDVDGGELWTIPLSKLVASRETGITPPPTSHWEHSDVEGSRYANQAEDIREFLDDTLD